MHYHTSTRQNETLDYMEIFIIQILSVYYYFHAYITAEVETSIHYIHIIKLGRLSLSFFLSTILLSVNKNENYEVLP